MSIPHAVVLQIVEKNCSKDEIDQLIKILETDYNFQLLGSAFDAPIKGNKHKGSSLIMSKPYSGDTAERVFEVVSTQLDGIDLEFKISFECRLTIVGATIVSDSIVIE